MTVQYMISAPTVEKGEPQMRLIKMFGLAAVATVTAMAIVGATSASAANTQLCNTHTALTCGSPATRISLEDVTTSILLNDLVDIECSTVKGMGTPLGLASPQSIHFTDLEFGGCETSENSPCEIEVLEQPLANLNKTGLDAGILTATNGKVFLFCENAIFGADIECEYDLTGASLSAGAQHATANETPIDEIGSDLLCPNIPTLDALLVMVDPDLDLDKDNEDAEDQGHEHEDEDAGDTANRYILA
jgi:hypothetical protein